MSSGLNHLKGSNCDIHPFLEAFKQDDLVCGVNCCADIKRNSNRAITSANNNKGSSRKTIYGPWDVLKLNAVFLESRSLGKLAFVKPWRNILFI